MIQLKNVTLRRGSKVLLDGASATINPGEKVGLVGRNGAGKSSLFALLNGTLHEDSGDFSIPPTWRMAQVAQEMPETDQGATAFVLDGDLELAAAQREVEAAEAANDGERMALAYMALQDVGAHDAPARAQALLLGLGFRNGELDQPVNSFSGGWRMRLQLARALICPSELLLLDEPTNHLDLDALVWLENWLERYPGTLLVISHDREFLDAITTVTLHIEAGGLTRYGGNYSRFEDIRAEQLSLQQSTYSRQQEKIAHLQKFIDRFKAKASKAKQAQSRVKALERMEKIGPVLAEADFDFEFKEPQNLPNPMLALRGVAVGYPGIDGAAPTVIVRGIERSVLAGQRIGILGANGQGKSTLVKTVARMLAPVAGEITEGKGLNIGYFAQQELDVLRPQDSPLEHMVRLAREISPQAREQELRNFLGGFNFSGEMVRQSVGSMSGGEKARLVLCMIVWQRPNLLLLDEPTNHLDLATREALSVALNEFEGTVLLVSHDRALLRTVCDEFWLVSRGGVADFDGDLDDYQRYLLDEARRTREAASVAARAGADTVGAGTAAATDADATVQVTEGPVLSAAEQRRLDAQHRQQRAARTRPIRRELETLERRLASLHAEIAQLNTRLTAPLPPAELADAGRCLKTRQAELDDGETRWLELTETLDSIER